MSNPASPFGPIAEQEYDSVDDAHRPALDRWLDALPALPDDEFLHAAASAIHDSALAERFRGNWNHDHCRATAAFNDARRRHRAAGHADSCTGDTLYAEAHRKVWIEQGHSADAYPPRPCDCGAE